MSSQWGELWNRVRAKCPVALMTRGTLEYLFTDEFLDEVFDQSALNNYAHQFLFSDLVGVLTGVVFSTYPSVRRAFLNRPLAVARGTLKCFYEKLQRVEPTTMRALVRATADRVADIRADHRPDEPIPERRLMVLDGNHLGATDKRLDGLPGAPRPGQALALLEHGSGLVREVLPWEDAHANEKEVLGAYGLGVRAGDVVVADRQFCAQTVMDRINVCGAQFVLRHNASVGLEPEGPRRACGTSSTGAVYESVVRYAQTDRRLRLVEVELTTPTRTGDTVIRVLTDVPAEVADAHTIAGAYLCRRRIETVFWELTVSLTCEVKTLAYPRAALLAFCVTVSVYNALQAVKGAVAREHGADVPDQLSGVVMAEEVGRMWDGLDLAIGAGAWSALSTLSPPAFGRWLREATEGMNLDYYRKTTRGPKKPKAKGPESVPINKQTATFRFLQQRKNPVDKKTP